MKRWERKMKVKKTTDTYEQALKECKSSTVTAQYVKSKQAKEEVKSCNNCEHKDNMHTTQCIQCRTQSHWTPKLTDEKPKVKKYKLKPRYSGRKSVKFWNAVHSLNDNNKRFQQKS
jgi:hypothetical protein